MENEVERCPPGDIGIEASADDEIVACRRAGVEAVAKLPTAAREAALLHLLETAVGPLPFGENVYILPVATREVHPDRSETFAVQCYARYRPRRLVILESTEIFTHIDRTAEFQDVVREIGPWYRREMKVERVISKSEDRTRLAMWSPRRAIWGVSQIYVGSQAQFLTSGEIQGDAFGPDGSMDFDGTVCQPGICVSLAVRNGCTRTARFAAVILGERVPEPPAEERRRPQEMVLGDEVVEQITDRVLDRIGGLVRGERP